MTRNEWAKGNDTQLLGRMLVGWLDGLGWTGLAGWLAGWLAIVGSPRGCGVPVATHGNKDALISC